MRRLFLTLVIPLLCLGALVGMPDPQRDAKADRGTRPEEWLVPGTPSLPRPQGACPTTPLRRGMCDVRLPEASHAKPFFLAFDLRYHGARRAPGASTEDEISRAMMVNIDAQGLVHWFGMEFPLLGDSLEKRLSTQLNMKWEMARKRNEWTPGRPLSLCAARSLPWSLIRTVLRANAHALRKGKFGSSVEFPTKIEVQVAGDERHCDRRMMLTAAYEEDWYWLHQDFVDTGEVEEVEHDERKYRIQIEREEANSEPVTRIVIGDANWTFPSDAFDDAAFVRAANRIWREVAARIRRDSPQESVELCLRRGLGTPWIYVVKVLDILNLAGIPGAYLPVSEANESAKREAANKELKDTEDFFLRPIQKPQIVEPTSLHLRFAPLPPSMPEPLCGPTLESEPRLSLWIYGIAAMLALVIALSAVAAYRRRSRA